MGTFDIWDIGLILYIFAACFDLQQQRIPNVITFTAAIIGIVFRFDITLIIRVAVCIGLLFFGRLHLIGFGDLKLLMSSVLLVGFWESDYILFFAEIFLIAYALITNFKDSSEELKLAVESNLYLHKMSGKGKGYPFAVFYCLSFAVYGLWGGLF